ncbi:MAG: hypothetical protein AVDCRST_MAG14-1503, partial [uncultured Rubrobacteraceae bacterium]
APVEGRRTDRHEPGADQKFAGSLGERPRANRARAKGLDV